MNIRAAFITLLLGCICPGVWSWMSIYMTPQCTEITGQAVKYVGVGEAGIWAVGTDNGVYYRQNSYKNVKIENTEDWTSVPGSMKMISVGKVVVATDFNNIAYVRQGAMPIGTSWLEYGSPYSRLAVSDHKKGVWAVYKNVLYRKSGVDDTNLNGDGHFEADDDLNDRKFVSVGKHGLWALSSTKDVFYGHYSDFYDSGVSSWTKVGDDKQFRIAAEGDNYKYVVAINNDDRLMIREGITTLNRLGTGWTSINFDHDARQIVVYEDKLFVVTRGANPKLFGCTLSWD